MNAAKNQPSILTLRLGQSDQAGLAESVLFISQPKPFSSTPRVRVESMCGH